MRRRRILIGGVAVVAVVGAAGAYFALTYEPGADNSYDTRVAAPKLMGRRPRVLFDSGHRNLHSSAGRYGPFVRLIESDGCRASRISSAFSAESLRDGDILVVVNAKGPKARAEGPAFSDSECDAVREWVRGGGSLLLVADHHPCGPAAAGLARRFGVEMSGGWTDDEKHAREGAGDPGQIVFTRTGGGLGSHAILDGGAGMERVETVETFTGQSLKGPAEATALLVLSETAIDRVPVSSKREQRGSQTVTTFETKDSSAAGRCQGLAMSFGKGRVVVLGEAAMLTAQIDDKSGRKFGMNAGGNDNRTFALNVVRWLAGESAPSPSAAQGALNQGEAEQRPGDHRRGEQAAELYAGRGALN